MKTSDTSSKKTIDNMDNIKKNKFVEFYSSDEVRGNISLTCQAVGIVRQTYYNWLENDEEFRNAIKESKLVLCDDMEGVLINKAASGSTAELIYWLKNNHEGYKEKPTTLIQNNFRTTHGEWIKE